MDNRCERTVLSKKNKIIIHCIERHNKSTLIYKLLKLSKITQKKTLKIVVILINKLKKRKENKRFFFSDKLIEKLKEVSTKSIIENCVVPLLTSVALVSAVVEL